MLDPARAYEHPVVAALLGEAWRPGGLALTRELLDLAGIGGGQRVLDAACGRGASARLLAARGCDVVGLDAGRATLRAARGSDAALCAARAPPLPFRDGAFDAVLVECALCIRGGGAFLGEARRVLAPGGRLALGDVTVTRPRASYQTWPGALACLAGAGSAEDLAASVRAAGFSEVQVLRRDEAVRAWWRALAATVDVQGLARELAPALAAMGLPAAPEVVADIAEAVERGEVGYALLAARRN